MAGRVVVSTLNNDTGVLGTQNGMTGIAKAWVRYNQATSTINGSFNVTSITNNGTGDFTINFTTAMPDANYAAVTGGQNDQGNNGYIVLTAGGMTASSVQVMSRREAGFGDGSLICVSIFR